MRTDINAIRARVRGFQRKLARELAACRLDLLSRDLCHRWFVAQSDHKPLPGIQPFINRVIGAGYRLLPLAAANNYLLDCQRKTPNPNPKSCSTLFSPRMGDIPPAELSADGTRSFRIYPGEGTTLHMPCLFICKPLYLSLEVDHFLS